MIFWNRDKTSGIYIGFLRGWIRLGDKLYHLKAPWDEQMFSERHGYYKWRYQLPFGWRVIFKVDNPIFYI